MKMSGKKSFHPNCQAGFTMVELMIVISILAILASITMYSVSSILPRYRLNGAIRAVRGDLYNAKMLATKRNVQYRVNFTANDYDVERGTTSSGSFTLDAVEYSRDFSDYTGVSVDMGATTGNPLTFNPRGTATTATIALLNSEGTTKTITTSIAGKIKVND